MSVALAAPREREMLMEDEPENQMDIYLVSKWLPGSGDVQLVKHLPWKLENVSSIPRTQGKVEGLHGPLLPQAHPRQQPYPHHTHILEMLLKACPRETHTGHLTTHLSGEDPTPVL